LSWPGSTARPSTKPWPWPASAAAPKALALVAASGSDYLIAQVAPPALARAAIDRIAAALPAELRLAFLRRGHLAAATR
jgi:hypothetical protein